MKTIYNVNIKKYTPIITQSDMQIGYIFRYFVSKANQINDEVYEVDHRTYISLKTHPFIVAEYITWTIKGPLDDSTVSVYTGIDKNDGYETLTVPGVISQNKGYVEYVSNSIPAIKNLLTDYKQFYVAL